MNKYGIDENDVKLEVIEIARGRKSSNLKLPGEKNSKEATSCDVQLNNEMEVSRLTRLMKNVQMNLENEKKSQLLIQDKIHYYKGIENQQKQVNEQKNDDVDLLGLNMLKSSLKDFSVEKQKLLDNSNFTSKKKYNRITENITGKDCGIINMYNSCFLNVLFKVFFCLLLLYFLKLFLGFLFD